MQNRDGRVTKRDFRRVLESFCFRMSQQQFHELMAMIDPYNKGYVSYLEFLDRFEQRETKVIYSAVVFSKRPDGPALLNEISLPTLPPWRLKCQPHPLSPGLREKNRKNSNFVSSGPFHLCQSLSFTEKVTFLGLIPKSWQARMTSYLPYRKSSYQKWFCSSFKNWGIPKPQSWPKGFGTSLFHVVYIGICS